MQSFTISKVQAQSYYAIRVFGIVHLFMGMGIVVLLDGPSNGLLGGSWVLLIAMTAYAIWLAVQMYLAAKHRYIYGHYVLTKITLAIVLPGKSRVFVRRRDCRGLIPFRWDLLLRGGRRVSLRSPSSRAYRRELVSALCQQWWPALSRSPVWPSLLDGLGVGTLRLQIALRNGRDTAYPMLVFRPGRLHYFWHYGSVSVALLIAILAVFAAADTLRVPVFAGSLLYGAMVVLSQGVIVLAVASFWGIAGYLGYWIVLRRAGCRGFVLTARSVASVQAGVGAQNFPRNGLVGYAPGRGALVGREEGMFFSLRPFLFGGIPTLLDRWLWVYWLPELQEKLRRSNLTEMSFHTDVVSLLLGSSNMAWEVIRVHGEAQLVGSEQVYFSLTFLFFAVIALAGLVGMVLAFRAARRSYVDLTMVEAS